MKRPIPHVGQRRHELPPSESDDRRPRSPDRRATFTPAERRAFRLHAVLMAATGVGMFVAAPPGWGKVIAVLVTVALLPVPPLVILLLRRFTRRR